MMVHTQPLDALCRIHCPTDCAPSTLSTKDGGVGRELNVVVIPQVATDLYGQFAKATTRASDGNNFRIRLLPIALYLVEARPIIRAGGTPTRGMRFTMFRERLSFDFSDSFRVSLRPTN